LDTSITPQATLKKIADEYADVQLWLTADALKRSKTIPLKNANFKLVLAAQYVDDDTLAHAEQKKHMFRFTFPDGNDPSFRTDFSQGSNSS
jgi:hypothetical protein